MSVDESLHGQQPPAENPPTTGYRIAAGDTRGTWSNWHGLEHCRPQEYVRARSVDEVREVVARSASNGKTVRPVGSSHSLPPLVSTSDVMLDIGHLAGVVEVDTTTLRARVHSGTTIAALGPLLWDAGVSLLNQGGMDGQTIAGAVSTGTHGAGLGNTSMSGAVTGAEIVTASGDLVTIGENDTRLPAVMTSLGALGVTVSLELAVAPAHHLSKHLFYQPLDEVLESWWEKSRAHRHYSFWWGPVYPGMSVETDLPTPDMADPCLVRIYDEVESGLTAEELGVDLVDRAYRIYPDDFNEPWDEFEYHVPYVDCLDALVAIRPLLDAYPDVYPVEFRTVKGEPGFLAPAHGRDSVAIGLCRTQENPDNNKFFRGIHDVLGEFGARPHWGKGHMMTAERVAEVFPRYRDFVAVRRDLDPSGTFLNEHLRGLVE